MQIPPVDTVDYHTAGEPFRIVADPPVPIPGNSVADRRIRAIDDPDVDGLRQVLCFEPRGRRPQPGFEAVVVGSRSGRATATSYCTCA